MIPFHKHLEPYFKIAEEQAHKSPCVRRQYGAVLAYPTFILDNTHTRIFESSFNERVSPCCNEFCVRDRVDTRHGGSVEIGGEIHAETSLLIKTLQLDVTGYFILVGFEKGKELYGTNVYPCHSCAMAIKYAGYKHIYIRESKDNIKSVSIASIIEYRMNEWTPVDGA